MGEAPTHSTELAAVVGERAPGPRLAAALAAVVAAVATAGSLYFSEVLGLVPCELCWFQRIFMYPLVVVFGLGALLRRDVAAIGLGLAVPGALVSAYHSALQRGGGGQCTLGGGCAVVQYEVLGLSIPNLALIAFVLVVLLASSPAVAARLGR